MANLKSSKKRILVNKFRNKINRTKKSIIKTYIKKIKKLILNKNIKEAKKIYFLLQSILDKFSSKRYIHKNKASRYKSRLYKLF